MSDAIIAASLAAIVAVIGVIINNLVTSRNHARQLQHDRQQKEQERKQALRREVLLGVAEALQARLQGIMDFADLSLSHRDIVSAHRDSRAWLAKIHLVGSPDLVEAVTSASREIGDAFLVVRHDREPLLAMQKTLNYRWEQVQLHGSAALRFNEELEAAIRANVVGNIASLQSQISDALTMQRRQAQEHDKLAAELRQKHLELVRLASKHEAAMLPLLLRVVKAARIELGESIDMLVYERLLSPAHSQRRDELLANLWRSAERLDN